MTEAQTAYTELLGRRVRMGKWEDQKVSTFRKVGEALDAGKWDEAAELESYFVDEANVIFTLYRQWIGDLTGFLRQKDVDEATIEARNAQFYGLSNLPDGSPWKPRQHWDRFLSEVAATTAATYREKPAEAKEMMATAKETWRQGHDRDVDQTYALMSLIKEELGEGAVREMFDLVLLPLFAWRYEKFDIDKYPWDESLETLMLVACEAMRGHLVGPERTGDFELVEEEDRFVLRFDPCGSGQRTMRGDSIEGTPSRMEPPYNWTVTEEPHTWNHNTPGVCLYCTHCIILMEEMPIDRFGYPVRVVDPPVYPDGSKDPDVRQKCQWIMYKDPTQTPEEYYTRVGRTKPTSFGSKASGAKELPVVNIGLPGAG